MGETGIEVETETTVSTQNTEVRVQNLKGSTENCFLYSDS